MASQHASPKTAPELHLDLERDLSQPAAAWTRVALFAGVFVILAGLLRAHTATRRPKNFPPGPPTVPLLGNLASIPLVKSYVTFAAWARRHGPILGLKAGPLNLVVLHDPDDVRELLDKRGHVYAGRPYNYIALNHVWDAEFGQILLFQRNDRLLKRWKRPAKWFLGQQGIDGLGPVMDAMGARCVARLAERPGDFLETLRSWALGTPLVALTGRADVSEGLFRTYFKRQRLLTGLLEPGKTPPVDFVAPLRWVPARWARWKRDARFVREHQEGFYAEMMGRVKAARERRRGEREEEEERKRGDDEGGYVCVMERLLDEGMPEKEVKWLAGGLLDAAYDTSSASVLNFVVALAAHPDVMAEARREVDGVCGETMPRTEHLARMPYLKACMMETFRWRPATPLGLPHVADADDTYKGFVIPRGTNVVINAFAILHDERIHPDPDTFDPSRYLGVASSGDDDYTEDDERAKSTWVFGAGRRKCLGEQYTMRALLGVLAKMVWALDMGVPEGTDLSVEGGFDGGLTLSPKEGLVVEMRVREGRGRGVREGMERGEKVLKRVLGEGE